MSPRGQAFGFLVGKAEAEQSASIAKEGPSRVFDFRWSAFGDGRYLNVLGNSVEFPISHSQSISIHFDSFRVNFNVSSIVIFKSNP